MDDVLTKEQVDEFQSQVEIAARGDGTGPTLAFVRLFCDSHEALRARVAELEAEVERLTDELTGCKEAYQQRCGDYDRVRKSWEAERAEVERLTKERNDVRGVARIGISTMPCVKRLLVETNDAELADAVVAEVEALQERVNDHREEADVMYDRYKRVVVERDKAQAEASRFRSALVAYAHHGHWDNEDEDERDKLRDLLRRSVAAWRKGLLPADLLAEVDAAVGGK
jgi:chromosome segregation ATPase